MTKQWTLTALIMDDGIEDPEKEIAGKYFSAQELVEMLKGFDTAGLTLTEIKVQEK